MNLKNIMNYLMIFTVFSSAIMLFKSSVEFYAFYLIFFIFILLLLIFQLEIAINKTFLILFIILSGISLINTWLAELPTFFAIKQIVGISFSSLAYYLLIKTNKYNVESLFKLYLKIAYFVCCLGIIQEVSYVLNFSYGYDYAYILRCIPLNFKWGLTEANLGKLLRVNSIMFEPSNLAVVITPAMFVALNNLLSKKSVYINRTKSLIVLLTYFLTFSSTAYLGFISALMVVSYRFLLRARGSIRLIAMFVIPVLIFIIAFVPYYFVPEINERVRASIESLKNLEKANNMNVSVFALFSNYYVASESFKNNPLFGSSLGSHAENYNKYASKFIPSDFNVTLIGINKEDANSLFLRLLSETGLFGIIIMLYFVKTFFIGAKNDSSDANNRFVLINNGIFIMILLRLLRCGHYFQDGLFFFIFLYYFTCKMTKKVQGQRSQVSLPKRVASRGRE